MHFFQFYPYSHYRQGFIFIFIPTLLKTCWPYFCLLNTSNSFPLNAFAFLTLAYILPLIICMANSFLSVLSHPTFNIISSKILWLNISAFFLAWQVACGILFPQPGIKPVPAVEAWSPNQWPTRELPEHLSLSITLSNEIKLISYFSVYIFFFLTPICKLLEGCMYLFLYG